MPYRRGNFSYVIDSSFTPFTLQEMLVPFAAYKDAYEKAEESYNELSTKAGDFKYLSEQMPEGSEAKAIYEGYANELQSQAEDLSRNGLTALNRGALTSLKRRYSGEIGTLQKADAALKEYQKVRDAMDVQDSTGIYASEMPTIDDFLPGKNFNRYRVSGKELYAAGAAASKAITSRMFGTEDGEKILQGQFLNFVQKNGMSPEVIERFRNDMSTNPALQNAIEGIAQQYGLYENLKDNSLERAKKSIINGVIDNAVYQVTNSPQKNLDYITPMEQHTMNLQDKQDAREEKEHKARMEDRDIRNALGFIHGKDEKGNNIIVAPNTSNVREGWGRDKTTGNYRKAGTGEAVSPYTGWIVTQEELKKEAADYTAQQLKSGKYGDNTTTSSGGGKAPTRKPSRTNAMQLDDDHFYPNQDMKGRDVGKPISYEDAVELNPKLVEVIPDDEKDLYFYHTTGGSQITIIPKEGSSSVSTDGSQPTYPAYPGNNSEHSYY